VSYVTNIGSRNVVKVELDGADRILLARLQEDAGTPINDLAAISNLSIASVQRRLRRLRQDRVIEREIAVLDAAAMGQSMTLIVSVEFERERPDQLQAFRAQAIREPQVQQCYYVTGEADFVLICISSDMESFEALTERLLFSNPNVRRFRTCVVMGRTKVGLSIPV
jgi:DNA-binding Lrp family transcriptional regulator